MKKILKSTIPLFLIALLTGCSSPLNDVTIDDFNLIRVSYNLIKEISSNGNNTNLIEVHITDKNYKGFKLEGGDVSVNGISMSYSRGTLENNSYLSNIEILPNTEYTIVITLANGETATSTFTTPTNNYTTLSYPKIITKGTDYPISWNAGQNLVKIDFLLDDDSFEANSTFRYESSMGNDTGTFVIQGTDTAKFPNATKCRFNLSFIGLENLTTKPRSVVSTVEFIYKADDISVKN